MNFWDIFILVIIAALVVLAIIINKKRPHCSCGCGGSCSKCSNENCSKHGKKNQH